MTTKLGPWDVGFPVRFRANGDTVHDAFYKHIQEIERIYGLLNALDSNKLDWSDMNAHITSANPHPNMTIDGSKITGTIDAGKISGILANANIPIGNVTGNIPAERVYGLLKNATIDSSKVNGLSDLVNDAVGKAPPVEEENYNNDGYVKFKGGFMIQWGRTSNIPTAPLDGQFYDYTFPTPFTTQCFNVVANACAVNVSNWRGVDKSIIIENGSITTTGFKASIQSCSDGVAGASTYYMFFIALGI